MKIKFHAVAAVCLAAPLLSADTIRFTESLVDRLIIENDPDFGPIVCEETVRSGTINAVLTVPGFNPNALTDETPLEISLGGWNFSRTVGEADITNATSLTFISYDGVNDPPVEIGRLKFSYAGQVITITGSSRALEDSAAAAGYVDGETGSFQGATEASITLGDFHTNRMVYFKGTHTVTRRVVGSGYEATPYDLDTVKLSGQTDDVRPTVAILSPRAAARLTGDEVLATARAGDNGGVSELSFSVNGGDAVPAQQEEGTNLWTAGLSLTPGTNVIRATSLDLDGNSSTTAVVTVFYVFPLTLTYNASRGAITGVSNGQYLIPGLTYKATAKANAASIFTGWSGDVSTNNLTVSFVMQPGRTLEAGFAPDPKIPPTVAILSPRPSARFSNETAMVTVRATDNNAVETVELALNGRELPPAAPVDGANVWTAAIVLDPGTNTIRAVSVDLDGNRSVAAFVKVTNLFPLNLSYDAGHGAVTGVSNGQYLIPGLTYKATARPNAASIFTGWSGDVGTTNMTASFVMQPGRALHAGLIANPWIPVKGAYHGLFCAATNVGATNSGFITLTLTDRGTFTGKIQHHGATRPFSGSFSWNNQTSSVRVARGPAPPLPLGLHLDTEEGTVTGRLTDGASWDSTVQLARAAIFPGTNTSPYAGRYTFTIPGAGVDSTNCPGGDSVGTVVVGAKGAVSMAGTLGDSNVFAQTTVLAAAGEFPMFASLYGGRGLLLGWAKFGVASESHDLEAPEQLKWIKPASSRDRYYPNGFSQTNAMFGARYTPPGRGTNALNWTSGQVVIGGGNVSEMLMIPVSLSNSVVKVQGANTNNLTVALTLPTGLFSGTFKHPATGKPAAFKGAVVQTRANNLGPGWFLGTNQSGFILFSPPSP